MIEKLKNSIKNYVPILPAIVLAAAVVYMLSQYKEGTYDAEGLDVTIRTSGEEAEPLAANGTYELEDGLYQGSGQGYGGEIVVAVEIESKSIANIWILSAPDEDETFLNRAKGVIDTILSTQETKVDVISGATYSSNGIIEAVKNALSGETMVGDDETTSTLQALEDASYGTLTDGTYTGSAEGFGGTIEVSVTISDGKIADIEVLQADGEGTAYLNKASALLDTMKDTQSTNVDVVSGATYTSNGLIKAVRNALAKAEGQSVSEESDGDIETGESGNFPYADGVYYGTGSGFAGDITVAIVIGDETLKAAIVTESSDDDAFLSKAKVLLDKIVARQNTDVDVVSGATYSSNGILEAVKNAIKAAKNGEKTTSDSTSNSNSSSNSSSSNSNSSSSVTSGTYKDGTYTIETTCSPNAMKAFTAYTLSMSVTIKNDVITAIKNVKGTGSSYESINDSFISKAVNGTTSSEGVVSQITSKGNATGIDVVSGATCTSNAIIEGAKTALKNAKKGTTGNASPSPSPSPSGGTSTSTPVASSSPTPSASKEPADNSSTTVSYKDGVYSGRALCSPDGDDEFYAYYLSLSVTVSGNKITSITDLEGSGSRYDSSNSFYYNYAANGAGTKAGVISQILSKQSTEEIDVVSGATCSSNAIISACEQALKAAK